MRYLIAISACLFAFSLTAQELSIGDTHQGGIIFYLNGNSGGLIAAPLDQQSSTWGCYGSDVAGADGTAIGTGIQNTNDIELQCLSSSAAAICTNLNLNGYSDWFLPSRDELDSVYVNLHLQGIGDFGDDYYWTSTEWGWFDSWYVNFSDGTVDYVHPPINKLNQIRVRAIRAFVSDPNPGCTDPTASNYDPEATEDDGSCVYPPGPCNDQTSITYQGYDYDIVEIGDQCWFAENLQCESYLDGSPISNDLSNWENTASGLQTVLENDPSNLELSGRLYNLHAVLNTAGICPSYWHVPTIDEWSSLVNFVAPIVGGVANTGYSGEVLKSNPSDVPPWNGTNDFGFSAYKGGAYFGSYAELDRAQWWSSSTNVEGWGSRPMIHESSNDVLLVGYDPPEVFYNVRCMRHSISIGCTIDQACNFNPDATDDDGSCLFVGESCDDGDETTSEDTVQEDCICAGTVVYGCTYPVACNYDPEATLYDDSCYFVGDPCDDGSVDTENDTYSDNCECIGEPVDLVPGCTYETACNYNPDANQNDMSCLFPGDACDDNDVSTGNDAYNDECECVGEVLQGGCTYEAACNYDPEAEFDNNTCLFIGDPCDDDDPDTYDDVIQEDCECAGTPSTSVDELEALSVLIYPNPASNNLNVDLGDLEGEDVRIQLYDSSGKLVFEELRNSSVAIDVSTYASGLYSIVILTSDVELKRQVVIE